MRLSPRDTYLTASRLTHQLATSFSDSSENTPHGHNYGRDQLSDSAKYLKLSPNSDTVKPELSQSVGIRCDSNLLTVVLSACHTGISASTKWPTNSKRSSSQMAAQIWLEHSTSGSETTMTSSLQAKKSNDRRCPPQTKVGAREAREHGDTTRTKKPGDIYSSKD